VRVIAPSGPFDRAGFEQGLARVRERYRVTHRQDIGAQHGYLAGDDDRRAAELLEALEDPEVHAIVAARGGYGATRILHRVPIATIASANKLLVGFSDVTALHALWAIAGVRSLHGAMLALLGMGEPSLVQRWIGALEGALPPMSQMRGWGEGVAEGPLLGGNLSVLAALLGTPYFPPLDGAVLFLEDLNEPPYRIDRMLTSLLSAGVLDGIVGVLLGQFTHPSEAQVLEVLEERLGDRVPVAHGLPSGHVPDNLEVHLGAPVRIEVSAGRATVTFLESSVAP
jgi:muramoyltetrapeptide carboxypeptidase